ncbi:GPI transamidase component PIG-S-like [Choristoneura fumiferana]|uniref:GPI transamidase component PIG-S-like n=1 Tax=Choristoneura fumiferana TaxID=7141 RepID=UPI003D1538D4
MIESPFGIVRGYRRAAAELRVPRVGERGAAQPDRGGVRRRRSQQTRRTPPHDYLRDPTAPTAGIMEPREKNGATMLPSRSVTPRRWEVDALMRLRLQEQLASGKLALQSLADLLAEISNIVINDEVGSSINAAVEGIYEATELMSQGHLEEAYRVSQKAFLAAEAAFADPSLLALLYFPDDQKYAIYIPLFLPIMFPVVLSLKNLFLWIRGKPLHKERLTKYQSIFSNITNIM